MWLFHYNILIASVAFVQTFLTAHELSICLHSSPAVFDKLKCQTKLSTFDGVDKYSLIYGAFYQLLNSMLVHRTETVFHLVPVFTDAVRRILASLVYQLIADCTYCKLNDRDVPLSADAGVVWGDTWDLFGFLLLIQNLLWLVTALTLILTTVQYLFHKWLLMHFLLLLMQSTQ